MASVFRILALSFSVFALGSASAFEGSGVGAHVDYALPVGKFGGQFNPAGEADAGFGAGLDVTAMLTPALGWTAGASLLFNPLRDTTTTAYPSDPGSYIDIPVFMGPTLMGSTGWLRSRGYLRLAGGINFTSITDSKISGYTIVTGWSAAFGYSLGAGVVFADRFDLGLRVYSLGESDYPMLEKSTAKYALVKTTPTLITLSMGWHFGSGK
jgi:hypothetical protein